MAFPFDDMVLEPDSEGWSSPHYSKEDMKKRKIPCLIVVPKSVYEYDWWDQFSRWVGADGIQKFYFGDHMEP